MKDQHVKFGDSISYAFPTFEDKEGLPVIIKLSYQNTFILPAFIKSNNNGLLIEPTNVTKLGQYLIGVELTDDYSPSKIYSIKIYVESKMNESFNQEQVAGSFEIKQILAKIKILQMSKDGIMQL